MERTLVVILDREAPLGEPARRTRWHGVESRIQPPRKWRARLVVGGLGDAVIAWTEGGSIIMRLVRGRLYLPENRNVIVEPMGAVTVVGLNW